MLVLRRLRLSYQQHQDAYHAYRMPQFPRVTHPKYNSVLDPDCATLCNDLALQNIHICQATMALELAYETIAPAPTLGGVMIGIGSCDPNMLEPQRNIEPYPIRFTRRPPIEIGIIVYCFRLKSTVGPLRNTPRDWDGAQKGSVELQTSTPEFRRRS